ncbi:MAG: ABC transporter permease [Spirochaetaceae bacterium]|nr:MAG: ABC transporter permease [Spirochaetaceae bacterium]
MSDPKRSHAFDTPTTIALRELRRSRSAIVGAAIMTALIVVALIAPLVSPYDPIAINPDVSLQGPSGRHWMGTDDFGRDILSRVLHGTRISLRVGIIAVGIGGSIGLLIGLAAGYIGGRFDFAVMRFIDVMLSFPGILLALLIMAVLGPSLTNVMIAVGISNVPLYVRLVRGTVLSAKENGYVEAARGIGCSNRVIIVKHILPNIIAPFIVVTTLEVANAILLSATLSFLGMGAQPPTPEWGAMLNEGRRYIRTAWWMITFPGLMIMLSVLGINLLGDGLRDALDPKLSE